MAAFDIISFEESASGSSGVELAIVTCMVINDPEITARRRDIGQ